MQVPGPWAVLSRHWSPTGCRSSTRIWPDANRWRSDPLLLPLPKHLGIRPAIATNVPRNSPPAPCLTQATLFLGPVGWLWRRPRNPLGVESTAFHNLFIYYMLLHYDWWLVVGGLRCQLWQHNNKEIVQHGKKKKKKIKKTKKKKKKKNTRTHTHSADEQGPGAYNRSPPIASMNVCIF